MNGFMFDILRKAKKKKQLRFLKLLLYYGLNIN